MIKRSQRPPPKKGSSSSNGDPTKKTSGDEILLATAPPSFFRNKWVTMGNGNPSVLPLYHVCSSDFAFAERRRELERNIIDESRRQQREGGDNVDGGSDDGSSYEDVDDASARRRRDDGACAEAVRATVNSSIVARAFGCGSTGASLRSGGSVGASTAAAAATFGERAILEQPTDLWRLSERLVGRAESFIRASADAAAASPNGGASASASARPFFLYFPLVHPHIPHTPARKFLVAAQKAMADKSSHQKEVSEELATYGATLREADSMVKRVMLQLGIEGDVSHDRDGGGDARRRANYLENTLTVVTSDNGPWLNQGIMGGSPLPFQGGKFSTLEGGIRVFCLFHWPAVLGRGGESSDTSIKDMRRALNGSALGGVVDDERSTLSLDSRGGWASSVVASSLDLLPTFVSAAAGTLPLAVDRAYDGIDLTPLLVVAGAARKASSTTTAAAASDAALERAILATKQMHHRMLLFQEGDRFKAMRVGRYKVANLRRLTDSDNRAGFKMIGLVGATATNNKRKSSNNEGDAGNASSSSSSSSSVALVAKKRIPSNNMLVFDVVDDPGETTKLRTTTAASVVGAAAEEGELEAEDEEAYFYMSRWVSKKERQARNGTAFTESGKEEDAEEANGDGQSDEVSDEAQDGEGFEDMVALTAWEFRAVVVRSQVALWTSVRNSHRSDHVRESKHKASSLPCGATPLPLHHHSQSPQPFRSGAMCAQCKCDPKQQPTTELRAKQPPQRGASSWVAALFGKWAWASSGGGGEGDDEQKDAALHHAHRPNGRASCQAL